MTNDRGFIFTPLSEVAKGRGDLEEVRGLRTPASWGTAPRKQEIRNVYVRRDDPEKPRRIAELRRQHAGRQPIGRRLRFRVLERCGFACVYCGRRPPEVELVIDHVDPVVLGGTSGEVNLVAACRDCNAGKGATPLVGRAPSSESGSATDGSVLDLVLASPRPGATLRATRKAAGVSRRQLAEAWGWGRFEYVRELEEGRRSCPCTRERAAEYLEVLVRVAGRLS
jgi:5-methylcytosine-specific restriction endonuclease McrA